MNIIINSRHLDVTDAIRQNVEAKLNNLFPHYDSLFTSTRVLLEKETTRTFYHINIVAHMTKHDLVADTEGADFYAAFDAAAAKIAVQAEKIMDKIRTHQAPPLRDASADEK